MITPIKKNNSSDIINILVDFTLLIIDYKKLPLFDEACFYYINLVTGLNLINNKECKINENVYSVE